MQDLRVIGAEDGALVVSDDEGTRYRLPVDDVLQLKLRQVTPDPSIGQRLAPREIQSYIRSGMSAEDVATITGAPLDHIQRFEGPVLAEREFIVKSALDVPVHTAIETDPLGQGATFGSAMRARLHDLGATGERWASWKDVTVGWVVKLSFAASQIEHDARWHFDPKRASLEPINSEAITLSQQGEASGPLLPRLRAVAPQERALDQTRFDSGAFDIGQADISEPKARLQEATRKATGATAVTKPQGDPAPLNQTADLLDALRRRRGEREAASYDEFEEPSRYAPHMEGHPSTGSIRIVEIAIDPTDASADAPVSDFPTTSVPVSQAPVAQSPASRRTGPQPSARNTGSQPRARKGRTAMPSWDEIVFGARPDDDLA